MTAPIVSIITAAYNTEKFLPKSLDSILAQTFTDFELIVIDDCSTDQTPEILSAYAARDQRIVVLTNEQNKGPSFSRNRGLELAQGKYIAIQDADDVAHHERLAKQVAYLEAHPTVGVLSAAYYNVNEQRETIDRNSPPQTHMLIQWLMLYHFAFCHPLLIFRQNLLSKAAGRYYDEMLPTTEDYDLWDRLLVHTEAANLPDCLLYRTIHPQQLSISQRTKMDHNANLISHRAISHLVGREDFITLEEVTRLRPWYYANVPKHPTAADFALAHKWLHIWHIFAAKHQPNTSDKISILYRLTQVLWLMVWTKQPGSTDLFFKLCRLAPLQLIRTIFMYFARQIKRTIIPVRK